MLLLTSEQMRRMDECIMNEAGVSPLALMEAAGLAVATEAVKTALYGSRSAQATDLIVSHPLVFHIVVGKGHNGADGLVAARHLLSWGHRVTVWVAYPEVQLSPLCAKQLRAYLTLGGTCSLGLDPFGAADLVVDALLGTGAQASLRDDIRLWTRRINATKRPVLAVDVPTGVDATTGVADPDTVCAMVTVACGFSKVGLHQYPGRHWAGRVEVASLGMPESMARDAGVNCRLLTKGQAKAFLSTRVENGHKGTFGTVGVWAGSKGMYGAARFAVTGAYRAGAGLVRCFTPLGLSEVSAFLPPETVIVGLEATAGSSDFVAAFARELESLQIGLCGPGLGNTVGQLLQDQPAALNPLADIKQTLVLDADFLNALAAMDDRGAAWLSSRKGVTVITPHPKEFGRLIGRSVQEVQCDRVSLATAYANNFGVCVVLKGAGTVVALPDGSSFINTSGNSGMAAGGSGDVLAGLIAGLAASSPDVMKAVCVAVYVHGLAADLAVVDEQSEESLMASDLLDRMGSAFRHLRDLP